ncbi:hypothetical protein NEPAR06_1322 [Nematocida parisii]|uniref:Mediator complex subunit 15 KIX domain-containing protein n=1 Tax=Nematocida parisii (strain ERTm3) TaxID=935791 RepID=I3EEB7_NEMP3|nr:uncharacterized protein NEPG_02190 [Nematocida parisii ERTm1]EIJ87564.1 hypothetical protein NEQG_02111 [Nematocida parisii ERTm3]KAI5129086.1 hypothetical protein NEPAR08_1466 [Nematocida parisii]EIJ92791.1 hypothetical protein NEPG_02190 [Nematocida parisii ERTm1]KAI5129131.1 hypothetical protein NEPAR03_1535 [Nematocida parisii]KAI5141939.1 hypothetical protein NEPAR04_1307 [Nematocida parisii]|eukprot:XP_013060017.1 hypothetical protein NEPG_02190 [Nematocida parisii ERTm1]
MKHAPVGPEERKSILKKIYHALRQSPMFTHYSVEHIRDSAIKSEQLTFDRSFTKQEYMQAMHSKLKKIEKSYVMNAEEILREMGNKPGHMQPEPIHVSRPMGMFRDQVDKPSNSDMEEYSMHSQKKTGPEFVSLAGSQQGRGTNFSFIPDDSHMGRARPRNPAPHMVSGINSHSGPSGMGMGLGGGCDINNSSMQGYSQTIPGSTPINNPEMSSSQTNHMGGNQFINMHMQRMPNPQMGMHSMNNSFGQPAGQSININNKPGGYGLVSVGAARNGPIDIGGNINRVSVQGPNIIKLDPMTDLGSISGGRDSRNEMGLKGVEVNSINPTMQRDTLRGINTGMAKSMGRLDPFVPIGGFGGAGEGSEFSRMGVDHMGDMQGIGMGMGGITLGNVLHRTGAAGSTNTAAKMNNTRMAPPNHYSKGGALGPISHEVKPIKLRQEEKLKARPKIDRIESPVHISPVESSPRAGGKKYEKKKEAQSQTEEELKKITEEIKKMDEVLSTHQSIFPRWEKQRRLFYNLEDVLNAKIKEPNEEIENILGIFQQMKRQIITLSQEIKEGNSLTFKKRMGRISSAFMQKQKAEPEYQFVSTEELLLEYN